METLWLYAENSSLVVDAVPELVSSISLLLGNRQLWAEAEQPFACDLLKLSTLVWQSIDSALEGQLSSSERDTLTENHSTLSQAQSQIAEVAVTCLEKQAYPMTAFKTLRFLSRFADFSIAEALPATMKVLDSTHSDDVKLEGLLFLSTAMESRLH